jgi:hypothetical protein
MLNSRKIIILALVGVGAAAAGVWLWNENPPPPPAAQKAVVAEQAEPRDSVPVADEALPPTQAPVAEEDKAPEASDFADPDAASESLVSFAHQLSGLMERAMDSEKEALPAFTQLEQCARDPAGQEVLQARLICFANASRLSKEFPSLLATRFRTLAEHNPKLAGLLQTTGLE